jgi:SET and MYND domain-containing protein
MHDLPAGEEFTQSYFPLNASYGARQQRCAEQYGFACACPRCQVRRARMLPW